MKNRENVEINLGDKMTVVFDKELLKNAEKYDRYLRDEGFQSRLQALLETPTIKRNRP